MPVEHQDTIGALDYSRIYFSAADSYSFLDQAAFNKNLILSSLFHGDLVVPDIYFLIGNVFPTAFRSESSLAMELLKAGHIQPWFRTQGRGSFEAAFIDIQQSGIFGVREDAREIAEFLDKKLGREKTYKFGVWNGDLGASFNKVVQSFLEQPSPPVATHDVVQLWERTQPWRIDAIGDARARSAQNTLRRGEIIRAVGKQLGFESDDKALYPSELLESLSLGAKRRDLRHFLSWLSQSYYKNQADMFGIDRVYFDTVGFDQVGPYRFAALDIEVAREREEVLTQAILIPSVESLANMNRRELIAIRNGEEAQEYFSTLQKWKAGATENNTEELLRHLHSYAAVLRRSFTEKNQPHVLAAIETWVTTSADHKSAHWLETALESATFLPVVGQVVHYSIFAAKTAWKLYRYVAPVRETIAGARRQEFVKLNRSPRFTSHGINVSV